ncbi:hypothetical protein HYQ44_008489 [Verticillium longisporum]|nr:hypothetical protein HYQ44_008489 [Verticillium longisporum]
MPVPRSSNTCSQCRSRKVRCEGGPDPFANCERLAFSCSVRTASTPSSSSGVNPQTRPEGVAELARV